MGAGGASSFFSQLMDVTSVNTKNKQSITLRNLCISGHLLSIGRANFDPALFEQEFECGSIPKIPEGRNSVQDYKGRKHKDNNIEIFYSVHCKLFPDRSLVDFLKQNSIPKLYHDIHGETPDYETSNKNCVTHGRPRSGFTSLTSF